MKVLLILALTALGFGQITSIPGPSPNPTGGAVGGASSVATNQILYGASSGVATSTSLFKYFSGTGNVTVGSATDDAANKLQVTGNMTTSGTFGVGTTAPLNKFTVVSNGTANTAGDTVDYGASIIANSTAFGIGGNAAILNVQSNSTLGADVGGSIGFGGRYTGTQFSQFAIIRGAKENATDGSAASYLAFGTRSSGNITERARIDSAGNYGIGTASPAYRLDVGLTGTSGTFRVKDQLATTGATSVLFDIGAGQTAASTIFTINGVQKFAGTNTTGAGTALLGANSPAVTNTAPYTWIRIVTSDGSTAFIPVWK